MKREDIEKLIGGYATGTLTEDERRALFEAALSDQTLFDALAGEEAFREVLLDPRCRRQIDQALHPAPGLLERVAGCVRRPPAWALAGTLAATAAIALLVVRTNRPAQPEIQLAQRNEVQAPAPAPVAPPPAAAVPQRRVESRPVPPEAQSPALDKKKEAPAAGGAAGGVVGGIVPSRPAPSVQAEGAPALAEPRPEPPPPPAVLAEAPPAPQPAPPAPSAESQSKDVSSVAAGPGPVQFQARRPEPADVRTLGAAAFRQDAAAPPQVRYVVEVKDAAGQFVEANPGAPVGPGVPVRLVLTPAQPGRLSVLDNSNKLLFNTDAVAGARYTVTPPPAERKFRVILAPPLPTPTTSVNTALRESVQKGQLPGGRFVTTIDLTRPRN